MIKFEWTFPDWAGNVKNHIDDILLATAAAIQENRGQMFDNEGAHNGKDRWAPLKWRNGQILSDRGTLRKSWAPPGAHGLPGPDGIVEIDATTITVGTRVAYAMMMENGTTGLPGGVLRPKSAQALKIPLPSGKAAPPDLAKAFGKGGKIGKGRFIFRKSVKIPARHMTQWTVDDQAEVEVTLVNAIEAYL